MTALEYLPLTTKAAMTPCFLLSPWATSKTLEKSIGRIEKAFPHGNYFLDIDQDYQARIGSTSESADELERLKDPSGAFSNWCDFIARFERAMPCLQTAGQSEQQLREQVRSYQDLGRIYCLRVFKSRQSVGLQTVVNALNATGTADFVVILEAGWSNDVLLNASWFTGLAKGILANIKPEVPFVVSSTSFPRSFSHIFGVERIPFANRNLQAQVQQGANRARLIYGDWASTRPREYQGGGAPIPPRIDYARDDEWAILRNPDKGWTFHEAALELVNNPVLWDGTTQQWGEELIAEAATAEGLGVNTPQKNVASRVNLHLHRQAFFGMQPPAPEAFDDPWEDI